MSKRINIKHRVELTKETFYLHTGLNQLRQGGYYAINIVYGKDGRPYLSFFTGDVYYIKSINFNSVRASVVELLKVHDGRIYTDWVKIKEDDYAHDYISLGEIFIQNIRKDYKTYFKQNNKPIEIEFEWNIVA